MESLNHYKSKSGKLIPVFTLEIQTIPGDTDKLLDAIMEIHPLKYGRYRRTASISATGEETAQPEENSTTSTHLEGFSPGNTETYPMVELKITLERDIKILAKVLDVIIYNHHYEQPAIFVREDWASRSNYNPNSDNPNRWWNNRRGLPDLIS